MCSQLRRNEVMSSFIPYHSVFENYMKMLMRENVLMRVMNTRDILDWLNQNILKCVFKAELTK